MGIALGTSLLFSDYGLLAAGRLAGIFKHPWFPMLCVSDLVWCALVCKEMPLQASSYRQDRL
jgi:hypothetical protein